MQYLLNGKYFYPVDIYNTIPKINLLNTQRSYIRTRI